MSTNRCKKVRSIIAMLLAVVMMTGMLPTSAFAAGGGDYWCGRHRQ